MKKMAPPQRAPLFKALSWLLLAVGMQSAWGASSPDPNPVELSSLPMSFTLSFERARLPGGEHMGLVGGSLLFEATEGWWLGPSAYGAATGQRGGLFVGGVELQRRWKLGSGWQAVGGLYVGGGGGAAAQVGDGLMLRPALSLLKDLGGWQVGLSWSDTRFPDGVIKNSPWGIVLAWDGTYRHASAASIGQPLADVRNTGLNFDEVQGLFSVYPLRDGSDRQVGLPGARLLKRRGNLGFSMESSAAARGGAAGYMEILGGVSFHQPITPRLEIGARAALGLGGGGAVSSGGGGLSKLSAFVAWQPVPGWQLGLEGGPVRGAGGAPRATAVQAWLSAPLQPPANASSAEASGRVAAYEWTAGLQQLRKARRQDGSAGSIELVTGRIERHLPSGWYLAAEASSALGGNAGAFSQGLLGVGLATKPDQSWRFGTDLMAGAAGGAGVQTGGGAIGVARAWAAYPVTAHSQIRLSLGSERALQGGGLSTPVVDLSFNHRFGLGAR